MLQSLNCIGSSLEYASDELKNDREFILEAVAKSGYALKYASDEFRADREVVMTAAAQDRDELQYASDELRYDVTISECSRALKLKPDYAAAYNNRGIAYYAMKQYDQAIDDFRMVKQLDTNMYMALPEEIRDKCE